MGYSYKGVKNTDGPTSTLKHKARPGHGFLYVLLIKGLAGKHPKATLCFTLMPLSPLNTGIFFYLRSQRGSHVGTPRGVACSGIPCPITWAGLMDLCQKFL